MCVCVCVCVCVCISRYVCALAHRSWDNILQNKIYDYYMCITPTLFWYRKLILQLIRISRNSLIVVSYAYHSRENILNKFAYGTKD